jgi:thioester reductase-like protein
MEKIAIIGIGCRFPGSNNPTEYWELLRSGRDAVREVPMQRWDLDRYYDIHPNTPGKMNTRWGGFLDQVDRFDPSFFGITPKEAERIDPQHRLVMEVAWETIEDAAVNPSKLDGTKTGVFVGIGNYDYGRLLIRDPNKINAYDGLGNTLCIAANRLSYLLNLKGPSLVLESACSSSLVSIHYACRSLLSGESDYAICGGVSLMLSPEPTISYSHARMMSPNGRCKTFDASADGYVRGEGCGMVLFCRLSDAERLGHRIQAVIAGSAVNQDGRSNGLTAPNGLAQQAVISEALHAAAISADDVSYVEAHGTGTPLGDPLELDALTRAYRPDPSKQQALVIGSAKTNIGHLEAAAGMAGLLKVIMMFKHKQIPPHLHLHELNPYIQQDSESFIIPSYLMDWEPVNRRRLAGISSFGFGGTNSHLILEEYLGNHVDVPCDTDSIPQIFTLSAKSESALRELCSSYKVLLTKNTESSLAHIAFTSCTGRFHHPCRLACVADSIRSLEEQLEAIAEGVDDSKISYLGAKRHASKPIVFLFTGQGSQYHAMGEELYKEHAMFRQAIDDCDRIIFLHLGMSLTSTLYSDGGDQDFIHNTAYTQPILFAVEYALARLWMSWGIKPSLMIGHSLGEYVAAVIAEVMSLEDALWLVCERGKLISKLPPTGAMVAVWSSREHLSGLIRDYSDKVSIATVNGSSNCVLSGDVECIDKLVAQLGEQGLLTRRLSVSHAFHSPLMNEALPEFRKLAERVHYASPSIPILSNLTGSLWTDSMANADYWCRHLRECVNFLDGLNYIREHEQTVLLEIGPKPTLLGLASAYFSDSGYQITGLPSLDPKKPALQQIYSSLASLYLLGQEICWDEFYSDKAARPVSLPTYPFQRERYWIELDNQLKTESMIEDKENSTSVLDLIRSQNGNGLLELIRQNGRLTKDALDLLPSFVNELIRLNNRSVSSDIDIENWIHSLSWMPHSSNASSAAARSSQLRRYEWVILSDSRGIGRQLSSILTRKGIEARLIFPDSTAPGMISTEVLHEQISTLSPDQAIRILCLWPLDSETACDYPSSSIEASIQFTLAPVLELFKQLTSCKLHPDTHCWLITQQALLAGSETRISLAQAPLTAFVKVLSLEHSDRISGQIDLPESVDDHALGQLLTILSADQQESLYALRDGTVYVPRLEQTSKNAIVGKSLPDSASYLITGGLGSLGLHVARWLLDRGAKTLILTSRRAPDQGQQHVIEELEHQGVAVHVAAVDVTDEAGMGSLFAHINQHHPPLKGVFHCAGISTFCEAGQLSWDEMEQVLLPKTLGSWNLHRLTQHLDLDFFVGFSSIASVWGSRGQAHYAAANGFLDAVVEHRRLQGLPGLSIHWGPWAGGGMALDSFQQILTRMGVTPLAVEPALRAMECLLGSSGATFTVADVDWNRFREIYGLKSDARLFDLLTHPQRETAAESVPEQRTGLEITAQLSPLPVEEKISVLVNYLRSEVARILGYDRPEDLDSTQGLFDLGIDSLMAMDIVAFIRTTLSPQFSFLDLVNGSTSEGVARLLVTQLFPESIDGSIQQLSCDLLQEASLDPSISPDGAISRGYAEISPNILLTGVSGFLGAYLLHSLLETTDATLYCLVRSSDQQSGKQRIIQNLNSYHLWQDRHAPRIIPVIGNLCEPHLGLANHQYEHLSECIDIIYHSAAVLNFVYPYSRLKLTNIFGTQEILRLACRKKTKFLHYVSTDAVFDSSKYYDTQVVETTPPDCIEGIDLGYTQTKWVSERLVQVARERGLPVSIYRPPLITGHSRFGAWNTEDFTCLFLKGCVELGAIPAIDARVTFVPVDYVASAIVALSQTDECLGKNYHLSNPHTSTWSDVSGWIHELGYSLSIIPYAEWEIRLQEQAVLGKNVLAPLLPFFLKRWSDHDLSFAQLAQHRATLQCKETVRNLSQLNIQCPPVDRALISTYFSFFKDRDFIKHPLHYLKESALSS